MPVDEFHRTLLGLITAATIDSDAAVQYMEDTFPGHPYVSPEDLPSYLRLTGRMLGATVSIINGLNKHPDTRPYVEGILERLRDGAVSGP